MGLDPGAREDRQKMQRKPTDSEEAYDFFLRGWRRTLLSRYTAAQFLEAARLPRPRGARSRGGAQAWAALGGPPPSSYWTGNRSPRQLELARHAIEKAQALARDPSETQYAPWYLLLPRPAQLSSRPRAPACRRAIRLWAG